MSSVDVVVPCYRYGHYLRDCVGSVLSQEGTDVRVLVIDDASPDDSATVAEALSREDSRVSFIHHKVNKGHIATYNEGNDWVAAEYTLLLSADDYLPPGALKRATAMLDAYPELVFVFGKVLELHDDGRTEVAGSGIEEYDGQSSCVVKGLDLIRTSGARNCVPTPSVVIRSARLREAGGYRPELPHTGDMELWWRLATFGPVGFIGECQAVYRRHSANMSLGYPFLRDMEHRQAAIEWFFRGCSSRLEDAEGLRAHTKRALGMDAAGLAHRAFEQGDVEAARDLSAFAVRTCPAVRWSLPWMKLEAKLRVGPEAFAKLRAFAR